MTEITVTIFHNVACDQDALVGMMAELAGEGFSTASPDVIEREVTERGRELLRMLLQHVLDAQAAEPRLAGAPVSAFNAVLILESR